MKDSKKKRKIDEAGSSNLISKEDELRLLMEPLAKPVLIDLLSKLGSEDSTIEEEIKTIAFAYADTVHRKLYVRDLSLNTTSQSLRNAFKEYGEIENGKVIYEGPKKSCAYGYIVYKDVESAKKALLEPSKLIDGRLTLCILASVSDDATNQISDTNLRKLYIGNLSPQVTDGMLYNYFKGHGNIVECSVLYHNDSRKSRGYGFVTYKTVEAAEKALVDLHKKTFEGRQIKVQYANTNKGGGGQSSVPQKAALPVPPRYVPQTAASHYTNKGGGGQSSVPPTADLPVPPRNIEGYTYPETAALYATPTYPYPQTSGPPYPYHQTAAPPYPYPQTAAPYASAYHYPSVRPGPSTYHTQGYGQGPYPQHYNQKQ